jgi:hypothetical protein
MECLMSDPVLVAIIGAISTIAATAVKAIIEKKK